jgi:hypothetical protein
MVLDVLVLHKMAMFAYLTLTAVLIMGASME